MANSVNRISEVIIPKDVMDGMLLIKQGFAKLEPYLVGALTVSEIMHMAKLGEKSEPFVDKGIDFSKLNPNLVPRRCDFVEAEKDFIVYQILQEPDIYISQMAQKVANTRFAAGSEALSCVSDFYKSIKQDAEDGVADATPIYEEMRKRYINYGKKKTVVTPPTTI